MRRLLDYLSFRKNRYARPTQDWICGHAADGHACPLGPDQRGRCRNTGECTPGKSGDRFTCTRREADGGKCKKGPLPNGACSHRIPPCQPVPSLRRTRGQLVWMTVALTIGLMLVLVAGRDRRRWINPGELTVHHSTSATKCEDCHTQSRADALPAKIVGLSASHASGDSALCLKCHAMGPQPLSTHSLAAPVLAGLTAKVKGEKSQPTVIQKASNLLAGRGHAPTGELACATCHQEHHGKDHDLKHLSNAQCQVCHSVQFESLANGHPSFGSYPYTRRTRIYFDHTTHLEQHFAGNKDAPSSCASCHEPGAAGRFMQVKSFESMCGSCHGGQITGEGSTSKGVAFFAVPGIDVQTLQAKGLNVGEWPKDAEAKTTPFMELLLSRQPAAHAAMEKLQGVDLMDLTKATPEQLTAAEQYAWAVKWLLAIMVTDGDSFLANTMKADVPPAGLNVPQLSLRKAQEAWMPHLLSEVANYQKGIKPPLPEKPKPTPAPALPPQSKPAAPSKSAPATPPAKPAPTDDILGGDEIAAAAAPTLAANAAPTPGDDILGGDEPKPAVVLPSAPAAAKAPPAPAAAPAEKPVLPGGWNSPAESYTFFYRPSGHADPFISAWLTGVAHLQGAAATPETRHAFKMLTDPQGPGLCTKCHTTDTHDEVTTINWSPAKPDDQDRPFTTFSHTKHFSVAGNAGCQSCHALDPKSEYAKYFSPDAQSSGGRKTVAFQSNFAPISKSLCADCHKPAVAGDGCVLCHRYHATSVGHEFASIGQLKTGTAK